MELHIKPMESKQQAIETATCLMRDNMHPNMYPLLLRYRLCKVYFVSDLFLALSLTF